MRVSPADADRPPKTLQSSGESSSSECQEEEESPYQRALRKLRCDERWQREISLGKRIGLYRLKEELGTGNFSQVRAAVHSLTKESVAVKILDKSKLDKKTLRMLAREIGSMEALHHPHLVRLYEVLETPSTIYLAMERAEGGELFHRISRDGRFGEGEARPLFAQITAALDHMHSHNIVHRDLKAENVFFAAPDVVKVGDFGFSTRVLDPHDPLRTFCGSPPYAAPELFRDDSYAGPAVDVWALGVLLYFMLTATMPFRAQTVAGLKRQILEGEFVPLPDTLGGDCRSLVLAILKLDPEARISLGQIKRCDWLRGQTLPGPLPREEDLLLPPPARSRLQALGITEDMVEEARGRGSRSSVVGTYRIVLHRCLAESSSSFGEEEEEREVSREEEGGSPKRKVARNHKSKMCTIL